MRPVSFSSPLEVPFTAVVKVQLPRTSLLVPLLEVPFNAVREAQLVRPLYSDRQQKRMKENQYCLTTIWLGHSYFSKLRGGWRPLSYKQFQLDAP